MSERVPVVTVRFYQELNDFVAPGSRGRPIDIPRTPRTVRDLIQSLGVPHTEVDLVLVNGRSTGFDENLADGDFVSVYPVFESLDIASVTHVRPAPLREPRFVLDVHLGALARLLRMLGFDSAWDRQARDQDLARQAAADRRTLLSRDRGLLMRTAVTHGYCVRSTEPQAQAVEVVRRFDLAAASRPFTRCLRCNRQLEPLSTPPATVAPAVRASEARFERCPACGRTYWRGSHWRSMLHTVDRILALSSSPQAGARDDERRRAGSS